MSKLTTTIVIGALALTAASTADAAPYRKCASVPLQDQLSQGTWVPKVKRMSCKSAREVVVRYGVYSSQAYGGSQAFERGGRFWLGRYRCTVYFGPGPSGEEFKAICAKYGRAFKIYYGG